MASADPKVLRDLRSTLTEFPQLRLVLLFGSTARGEAGAASDIDLAIDGPRQLFEEVRLRVSEALGKEVDVVSVRDAGIPLLRKLLDEGIVLREGEPGALGAFRARAVLELDLDGPNYDRMRDAWLQRVAERGFS